jgi:hypothetical protein
MADGQALRSHHHRQRLDFTGKVKEIAAEAALDGLYVVRTSLPPETLDDAGTVRAYKSPRSA